ncbi:MAG: D-alanine--D-alanine ligase [Candidatus Omnitrophica bacterium]|nr:D-alanine--D-alanine ligase [Candidatus Omnitrophota bacterium]MDD5690097.1 D-alanine--D-alanine ligase [Candidatus Omnitrophota bacterium]
MEIRDFGRVGVLMGGPSSERDISFKSGKAVLCALKECGIEAMGIDIVTDSKEENIRLLNNYNLDCAFIALHGRFGEDGSIQEILEKMDLPYTGSGVKASRLAMDKIGALNIFKAGKLYVPRSQFLEKALYKKNRKFNNNLGFPVVVKPANHGSSIGLSIVEFEQEIPASIDLAFQFDERIVIEEYISGRELTVGVLDEKALPVIEIVPKHKFFDFEAKYQVGLTDYIIPASLSPQIAENVQQAALEAHKLLGCFGCSRTDIILSQDDIPFVLEINTIPGMTATSLLPKAARVLGIDFNHLCLKLLELAYEKEKV